MVIGLYTNVDRDVNYVVTNKMIDYLRSKSVEYISVPRFLGDNVESDDIFYKAVSSVSLIISFGGDGTVLKLLQGLSDFAIPVMGVNLGTLGFLTEVNEQEMFDCVDRILKGDYKVEERTILRVSDGVNEFLAVNDISLTRGLSLHTVNVDIMIDDKLSDIVKGDGALVSTPLGSTAYSLSCGGPIISPELRVLAVLAICPHSLHNRPMVIADTCIIKLCTDNRDGLMRLSVDSNSYTLPSGKIEITIKKSEKVAKFIRIKEENFYKKLINKLFHWNDLNEREY